MLRPSKAKQACVQNLAGKPDLIGEEQNTQPDPEGFSSEEEWPSDSDLPAEHSAALGDDDDDDDDDEWLDYRWEANAEEEDLQTEAELMAFSAVLQKGLTEALSRDAQERLIGKKRRPTRYDGFSKRTEERRLASTRKEAEDDKRQGMLQTSLVDMFRKSKTAPNNDSIEISSDESDFIEELNAEELLGNTVEPPWQISPTLTSADLSVPTPAINQFTYRDCHKLRVAWDELTKHVKSCQLDVLFRACITQMVGMLNLFLDEDSVFSWREASAIIAKTVNRSDATACSIRDWLHQYLHLDKLPLHQYGHFLSSIFDDEDFSQQIQMHLLEVGKKGFIRAQDIVDFIDRSKIQEQLGASGNKKTKISLRTVQRWLKKMEWRYGEKKNGMYIDGHECEDVVAYCNKFVKHYRDYEKRMVLYDVNGDIASKPKGFPVPQGPRFRLYLITHDESTFFQNDRRKKVWSHPDQGPTPQPKGEGDSLMVSDFLCPDFGRLKFGDDEARLFFRAGKNRDGYFTNDDLLLQTLHVIDIFEAWTYGWATALFLFDNVQTHRKRATDALSATKMLKNVKLGWTQHKDGPKMRDGRFADDTPQPLYFPDDHPKMPGWFKGMEVIIRECGLWPEVQKSALEELIESRGHICDFYPKFHCELNFIEQYWGAAKLCYRVSPRTTNIDAMEKIVKDTLDDVSEIMIKRYSNRSARFISGYEQGLLGPQAAWANKKYHGHHTLPADMVAEVRVTVQDI
ncbi:hypothetical protein EWM64_g7570 [Hericium alpestre]|uniref:Uncharacterized protein n=1 Tax=Hericium alpestre TaxID=135208 RepID=A0A4Y9ZQY6_9AGAM|nr:hypothetical protein EWM64_g7570 [Hericium alpestre]